MYSKPLLTILALLVALGTSFANNCYQSSIVKPSPFMGNNDEIFQLSDGSFWQVKYEYEYLYEYFPEVIICPSENKLLIKGKNLNIRQITQGRENTEKSNKKKNKNAKNSNKLQEENSSIIESKIDGEFNGWEGETILKLMNGQIWQQTEYFYHYHYSYMPKVLIYNTGSGYNMQVDGIDKSVGVSRLK